MKMYPTPRTGGGSRPNGKGGKVLEEEVMIEYGLRERGKTLKQMYPTPRASGQEDAETLIKRKGEKAAAQHNLTAHMQMFPTPSAQEAGEKIVETLTSKDGSQLKPNERAYNPKTGKHVQMTLNRTVKMFPTPSASCHMDVVAPPETVKQNSSGWSVTRVGTGTKFGAKLNDVVNKVNQPIRTWWQIESNLCGVPNGISRELDKDRASRIKKRRPTNGKNLRTRNRSNSTQWTT
jgi:hypothetical protein